MFRQVCTIKYSLLPKTIFPQKRLISVDPSSQKQNEIVSASQTNSKKLVFTGNKNLDEKLDILLQKLYQLMGIYEEMIGLKELKMDR